MGSLLADYRPDIICEVLTRADGNALTLTLEPLGYALFHLTDHGPERREAITPRGGG